MQMLADLREVTHGRYQALTGVTGVGRRKPDALDATHLVNIYEKLNVHSRAELAGIVRASDRLIEAALRGDANRESGPFVHTNGRKPR